MKTFNFSFFLKNFYHYRGGKTRGESNSPTFTCLEFGSKQFWPIISLSSMLKPISSVIIVFIKTAFSLVSSRSQDETFLREAIQVRPHLVPGEAHKPRCEMSRSLPNLLTETSKTKPSLIHFDWNSNYLKKFRSVLPL